MAINMKILFVQDKIISEIVNKDVQNSISAATGKVTECLGRDPTGKRTMDIVNCPDYDMSDKPKQ